MATKAKTAKRSVKKSTAKSASSKKATAKKTTAKKTVAKKAPAKRTASRKAGALVITVVRRLTDEGVECQAMRQDRTKKLFTLIPKSKLRGFHNGDHVEVKGTVQQITFCQQGTTVSINTIRRIR